MTASIHKIRIDDGLYKWIKEEYGEASLTWYINRLIESDKEIRNERGISSSSLLKDAALRARER